MATMYENLCGNSVDKDRVDISLTVHSHAILKMVKSMCIGIKKNQMHTNEMSTLRHPHSCHINFRT
jgi:hypothetical protein